MWCHIKFANVSCRCKKIFKNLTKEVKKYIRNDWRETKILKIKETKDTTLR